MSNDIRRIVATDCGSTTTKAILIERNDTTGEYRLVARGEAPTTVERPFEDVTLGVMNSITELEEITETTVPAGFSAGRRVLLRDGRVWRQLKQGNRDTSNVGGPLDSSDLYVSTSSAGGGLQMMVAGVVKAMSAESAERAALGAGAILMDTLSVDDGRRDYQKVERLRQLRPDIILMSGGTDGGTKAHLIEMAEVVRRADPKPRFGDMKLPIIYAGNKDAAEDVGKVLGESIQLQVVANLRPTLDRENLGPAREEIHEMFLEHVMQQAPGYSKLLEWTSEEVMATPNAVGKLLKEYAENEKINVLGVDIGGATTDVFSVFLAPTGERIYNRTVSANLGMSYSICNVLKEAGVENIARWLPFEIDPAEVRNRLRNKMIRPTTIPQTYEDLLIEHAVSREALRLAFEHHKSLARGLTGSAQQRDVGQIFDQQASGQTLVKMMELDMVIGSGGVLSHAPRRAQSALMMMDAYQPEGVTMLTVDSIFMMPHLGVLSEHLYEAAKQVFERDCIVKCGHCVAPVGAGKEGEPMVTITGDGINETANVGDLKVIPCGVGEFKNVTITPTKNFDVGEGKGKARTARLEGGTVGIIIDARGRPFSVDLSTPNRVQKLRSWLQAFGLPLPK
ncbi:glutamate mutase L [Fimbriimonas ginsengisoli]|uniref:Methylaspartate mutase n=1 Tax=Fimbriimonas ginsengisoli Gsoil 348 TaxID=661478 RepID=A0A068NV56_FIMGI|nr:glutamate mutase L [Fimbriimonas ginsengisoli]AIE87418.1 Methylaspartate mutase [Fimbriimonas ginsengisoli Gsoil 348]